MHLSAFTGVIGKETNHLNYILNSFFQFSCVKQHVPVLLRFFSGLLMLSVANVTAL